MKTLNKIKFLISIYILVFLFPFLCYPQTHEGNIEVPTSNIGGAMIGDIVKSENHFFVYSPKGVIAYNKNGTVEGEIAFELTKEYGKVNPIYFWEKMYTASTSVMAYNENPSNPYLFAISPDLKIYIIDIDPSNTNSFLSYSTFVPQPDPAIFPTQPPIIFEDFKPLHGNCILKYDKANDRLFWNIGGQNPNENDIGSHHVRHRYFSIYNVSYNTGVSLTRIYEEYQSAAGNNYENGSLHDIEINQNSNDDTYDFFYLCKLSRFEVWKITKAPPYEVSWVHTEDLVNNYGEDYDKYKTSLKYINDNGTHKIIAYPYSYPGVSLLSLNSPLMFVLDGDHEIGTIAWTPIPSPSLRVTDIEFMEGAQSIGPHIVITYPANDLVTPDLNNGLHDIGIYEFNGNSLGFLWRLYTNTSPSLPSVWDYNTPIDIIPVDGTSALIAKEDEVGLLYLPSQNSIEYAYSEKINKENNLFIKGISFDNDNKFILNSCKNGLEVLTSGFTHSVVDKTHGFQLNHICMDNTGDKFYLFNKLNAYNPGCFIYEPNNENGPVIYNLNSPFNAVLDAPIGDCIYNPYLDQFLISENAFFSDRAAGIKVFNNDDNNSLEPNIISLEEENDGDRSYYARNMFIAPNGNLYVLADMNYGNSNKPKVFVFSAKDPSYPLQGCQEITNMPVLANWHDYFYGHFCYNQYNGKVYASLEAQKHKMTPYESSSNSLTENPDGSGILIEIGLNESTGNYEISNSVILPHAGKIVFPDMGNPDFTSTRYGNKMFIVGERFIEISPPYDDQSIIEKHRDFIDITFSPRHDMMFLLADEQNPAGAEENRLITLYTIEYNESTQEIEFNTVFEKEGQASSLFYNQYDGKVYTYQKMDNYKMGATPSRLLSFEYDPGASFPISPDVTDLGIYSLYPEFDHNPDEVIGLSFCNIMSPAINPRNQTMYIPNGGHSCISEVSYTPDEAFPLQLGAWSWISFPRMIRSFNNPVPIPSVLGGNKIEPNTYQTGSKLQYYNFFEIIDESEYHSINGWNYSGVLEELQSTLGYKLYLKYIGGLPDYKYIYFNGSLYDHYDPECTNCTLDLNGNADEYWVGYYHYTSQNVPDALPDDIESQISTIKGQYFTCYNEDNQTDDIIWRCVCNKESATLDYGDMVIITPKNGETIYDFHWNLPTTSPTDSEKASTVYYEYTETSDYTPIFIELDSTENPQEIGAFVNDSCIGGTTVLPEDSVVLISAYSDSLSGEIYFEEYYTQKSLQPPVSDYYVLDPVSGIRVKRMIHTREQKNYYIVSFKSDKEKEQDHGLSDAWIKCIPNPANSNSQINCYIPSDAYVEIFLFDIMGNMQMTVYSGMLSKGKHTFSFRDQKNLANGTYVLSLKSLNYFANTKIVLIK